MSAFRLKSANSNTHATLATTATDATLATTATDSTDAPQIRPHPPYAPCSPCLPHPSSSRNADIAASVACQWTSIPFEAFA